MDKRFLIIIAVLVVGFFGFLALRPSDKSASQTTPTNNVRGTGSVTLVEYGDFQCPACYAYQPTVAQIEAKYAGKIKLQFRNYPLTSIHQYALTAARAAQAAGDQGKFWEMHDQLYKSDNWLAWSQGQDKDVAGTFRTYAQMLNLNMTKYDADVNSTATLDKINADRAEGDKLNVTGTPTFFIDGQQLTLTENSVDALSKPIDAALAKQATASTTTDDTKK